MRYSLRYEERSILFEESHRFKIFQYTINIVDAKIRRKCERRKKEKEKEKEKEKRRGSRSRDAETRN